MSSKADGTSTFLSGQSMVDWQNVHEVALYGLLKLILKDKATAESYKHDRLTDASEKYDYEYLRERGCNLFAFQIDGGADLVGHTVKSFGFNPIKPEIKYAPYNLPDPAPDWGWNRYMMGKALIPFLFGEFIKENIVGNNESLKPFANYLKWYEWGVDVTNYLCGMNPWDVSMIIGAGEKFPHHIHNRTACAENANTGSDAYNFIPPYGALAPWVAPGETMLEDITEDGIAGQGFKLTETCVDFSMAVSLAMVTASGAIPEDIEAPLITDVNYIQIGPDEFYFSWNTNELANCELYWKETTSPSKSDLETGKIETPFENPGDIGGMKKFNELTINKLSMNKTYYFMIRAEDRYGNVSYAENEIKGSKLYYKFVVEEMPPAEITDLIICPKDEHTAQIAWWTDVPSNSVVDYWEFDDKAGTKKTVTRDDGSMITNFHVVTLKDLKPNTKYGFTAKSGPDTEDGDISSDIVLSGIEDIDTDAVGTYELSASITDSDNNVVTKKVSVIVGEDEESNLAPTIDVPSTYTIKEDEEFSIDLLDLTVTDFEDGDLYDYIDVEGVDEINSGGIGEYHVIISIIDSDSNIVSDTITVTVTAADSEATNTNSSPTIVGPSTVTIRENQVFSIGMLYLSVQDNEDGDLYDQITVEGVNEINDGGLGTYYVIISVIDSDSNIVSDTIEVKVTPAVEEKFVEINGSGAWTAGFDPLASVTIDEMVDRVIVDLEITEDDDAKLHTARAKLTFDDTPDFTGFVGIEIEYKASTFFNIYFEDDNYKWMSTGFPASSEVTTATFNFTPTNGFNVSVIEILHMEHKSKSASSVNVEILSMKLF